MNREFYVPCAPYAYPLYIYYTPTRRTPSTPSPQTRQMSQEFLAALKNAPDEEQQTTAAEEAAKIAPDELKNVVVASKDTKDGKGLQVRLSKFFRRNNRRKRQKQPEEISIGSSNTEDGRSSLSNESSTDNSKRDSSSSKLMRIGSQLMRLMKPRNQRQQREIKTEEEVIIVPQTDQDSINPDDRVVNYRNSNSELEKINENVKSVTEMRKNYVELSNETVNNDSSETGTSIIAGNPPAIFTAAVLNSQSGNQAEAEVQVSRRIVRDAPDRVPLFYLREESQNIIGAERNAITDPTGSESSSVAEVADAGNEQTEGRDGAEQYYNTVLREVIRKQFRHLDDEPPIY